MNGQTNLENFPMDLRRDSQNNVPKPFECFLSSSDPKKRDFDYPALSTRLLGSINNNLSNNDETTVGRVGPILLLSSIE